MRRPSLLLPPLLYYHSFSLCDDCHRKGTKSFFLLSAPPIPLPSFCSQSSSRFLFFFFFCFSASLVEFLFMRASFCSVATRRRPFCLASLVLFCSGSGTFYPALITLSSPPLRRKWEMGKVTLLSLSPAT